jgi:replicative DNA helicase
VVIETSPEMRYVGALLDKPGTEATAHRVPPEAFGNRRAAAIYAAILATAGKRSDVRCEDVIAELEERGHLATVGGREAVVALALLHADERIETVRREVLREASRRATLEAGTRLVAAARGGNLGDATIALQEASQAVSRFDGADLDEPLPERADHLQRLVERLGAIVRGEILPAPKADMGPLSRCLGQPRPGTLILVGGFSHAGKSFLMQYLETAYHHAGYPTIRLSLEDADPVTEARLLAEVAGFDLSHPYPDKYEAQKALEYLTRALADESKPISRGTPAIVLTPKSRDISALLRSMRRAVTQKGVKVVFVDYAQEVDVPDANDTRDKVARAVSALKVEAQTLGVTVVLGSQLRKPPPNVKNYEPTPHDLKDASELHHAAEVIILCWKKQVNGIFRRVGKVFKDKLTGSYPTFVMRDGIGGVIDALVPLEGKAEPAPAVNRNDFRDDHDHPWDEEAAQ